MADALARKENGGAENAAPAAKRTDLIGLLGVFLAVINLAALGGMGMFLQKLWTKVQEVQTIALKPPTSVMHEKEEASLGKELQVQSLGVLFPLEGFLVNINSDTGSKFLQIQMELELSEPALEEEVSRKKAAIRDAVIVMLSGRNFKELREQNGMKKLRQDLLKALNNLVTSGKIKDIFFTQFHFN